MWNSYFFIIDQIESKDNSQQWAIDIEHSNKECSLNSDFSYLDQPEESCSLNHKTYLPQSLNNQILDSELGKSEVCNKINSEDIETNSRIRKDVSYKNVFRATKKYYLALFKASSKFYKTHTRPEKKKIAHSELENFVQNYFINKDTNQILNGLSKEELVNIVGRIVIPRYMTKQEGTYK